MAPLPARVSQVAERGRGRGPTKRAAELVARRLPASLISRTALIRRREHFRLEQRHGLAAALHRAIARLNAQHFRVAVFALKSLTELVCHRPSPLPCEPNLLLLHLLTAALKLAIACLGYDHGRAALATLVPFTYLIRHRLAPSSESAGSPRRGPLDRKSVGRTMNEGQDERLGTEQGRLRCGLAPFSTSADPYCTTKRPRISVGCTVQR